MNTINQIISSAIVEVTFACFYRSVLLLMEHPIFLFFFFFLHIHYIPSLHIPRYANRRAVRKISRPLFNPRYRACPTMWIRNRGNSYTILEMAIIAKVRCHDRNLIIRKLDHHHRLRRCFCS